MLQLRVVFLLVALLLAGCAGLGTQRDSIRVTVSDIRVIEATLLEQVYQVTLRVQNRVADAIDIRGGSFDLAINGRDFGSGVTDQSVTVPGYADAKIEVRMVSTVFECYAWSRACSRVRGARWIMRSPAVFRQAADLAACASTRLVR